MQAQQAILTFNEAEKSLGGRLLKIAVEIDRVEGYSEAHAITIARTAEKLGARMGLHGIDLTALKFAALAHDLGERAMNRNYLLQPGELSWEEILDLWRHPILGEQAAGELKLSRQTQLLIRWHHEWWNGGGYPDGLAGAAIPLGARILRAVDSYYALISDRPHRRRFDRIEAEQIIADLAGIEFDPQVVMLLLQVLAEEEASESAFAYPAPGGDEAMTNSVEDQPQPLDEAVHASAYARRTVEIPAESLIGNQSAAPNFDSSIAFDGARIEGQKEITVADLASSKAPAEAVVETQSEIAATDFTSSTSFDDGWIEKGKEITASDLAPQMALDETGGETQTGTAVATFISSEATGATWVESQTEELGVDFASANALDLTGAEVHTELDGDDFISSEAIDRAGVDDQTEMGVDETPITQDKPEKIES
jgi:HD domain